MDWDYEREAFHKFFISTIEPVSRQFLLVSSHHTYYQMGQNSQKNFLNKIKVHNPPFPTIQLGKYWFLLSHDYI